VAGLGALMLRDFEAMSRALLSTGLYLSDLVRTAQAWLGL
jgi:hypothetical protein